MTLPIGMPTFITVTHRMLWGFREGGRLMKNPCHSGHHGMEVTGDTHSACVKRRSWDLACLEEATGAVGLFENKGKT